MQENFDYIENECLIGHTYFYVFHGLASILKATQLSVQRGHQGSSSPTSPEVGGERWVEWVPVCLDKLGEMGTCFLAGFSEPFA